MIAPPVLIQNSWLFDRGCIGWLATHAGHMPESFGHVCFVIFYIRTRRRCARLGPKKLCSNTPRKLRGLHPARAMTAMTAVQAAFLLFVVGFALESSSIRQNSR